MELSDNGKRALKIIFSDFLTSHNSYNIKDKLGISSVGSLKLLRSLKEKNILVSKRMGNAVFYKPNLKNEYVIKLLELILLDYSGLSSFVKGWVYDLRTFAKETKAVFLFGSILTKERTAGDVDVCFILRIPKDYAQLQGGVGEINRKSRLKIHSLYLTEEEFEKKLREKDKPLVDMVRTCIVVHGQELFVRVMKNVQSRE